MTKHYDVIHTKTGCAVGSVSLKHSGWMFISCLPGRKGSQKGYENPEKAFPRWAMKSCEMVARD